MAGCVTKNVSDLIAQSPAADVERNVRGFMGQAFTKMDLVTREEFDIQADMLTQAVARASNLEKATSSPRATIDRIGKQQGVSKFE